jgi:hypothetical protein
MPSAVYLSGRPCAGVTLVRAPRTPTLRPRWGGASTGSAVSWRGVKRASVTLVEYKATPVRREPVVTDPMRIEVVLRVGEGRRGTCRCARSTYCSASPALPSLRWRAGVAPPRRPGSRRYERASSAKAPQYLAKSRDGAPVAGRHTVPQGLDLLAGGHRLHLERRRGRRQAGRRWAGGFRQRDLSGSSQVLTRPSRRRE